MNPLHSKSPEVSHMEIPLEVKGKRIDFRLVDMSMSWPFIALYLEEWMLLSSFNNGLAKSHVTPLVLSQKLSQRSLIKQIFLLEGDR